MHNALEDESGACPGKTHWSLGKINTPIELIWIEASAKLIDVKVNLLFMSGAQMV